MVNKHFFKTLIVFTGMIIVGLLGVFLVSYFDEAGVSEDTDTSIAE
ncbi:MAG: hypothetical protein NTW98_02050 [Candidatus Nomurabacteria bacterium]|nr:hypothetical protein [Candidatus Nomurabacteria bacterium]